MKAERLSAALSVGALIATISSPAFAQDSFCAATVWVGQETTACIDQPQNTKGSKPVSAEGATLKGNVLKAAAGNLSLNNASGLELQQANATAVSNADPVDTASATFQSQTADNWTFVGARGTIKGNVGAGAAGNVLVNNGEGAADLQANAAAISDVEGESGPSYTDAAVNQDQYAAYNLATDSKAKIGGNAFKDASGNIGVNTLAGVAIEQSNAFAVSTDPTFASSFVGQLQSVDGTVTDAKARIGGNAFSGASGNILVNNAAGTGIQQGNAAAIAVVGADDLAASSATATIAQSQSTGSVFASGTNAKIDGNAFAGAKGNLGVNNAAGIAIQQANAFTLITASH